jgi:hypothetical protein
MHLSINKPANRTTKDTAKQAVSSSRKIAAEEDAAAVQQEL